MLKVWHCNGMRLPKPMSTQGRGWIPSSASSRLAHGCELPPAAGFAPHTRWGPRAVPRGFLQHVSCYDMAAVDLRSVSFGEALRSRWGSLLRRSRWPGAGAVVAFPVLFFLAVDILRETFRGMMVASARLILWPFESKFRSFLRAKRNGCGFPRILQVLATKNAWDEQTAAEQI